MAEIRSEFEESHARADAEPWERYSAAAGMAEAESVSKALKQADIAMYEEKEAFHRRTGYRR